MTNLEALSAAHEHARAKYNPAIRGGACVVTDLGTFVGATVQTAVYPNHICALRGALLHAVSQGARKVIRVAVAGGCGDSPRVCGCCLELLSEFAPAETKIELWDVLQKKKSSSSSSSFSEMALSAALPHGVRPTDFLSGRTFELTEEDVKGFKLVTSPTSPLQSQADLALYDAAIQACRHCYTPASHFPVGAAVRTPGGKITSGANVETTALFAGLCAERTAVHNAIASVGAKGFSDIALICWKSRDDFGSPCGSCRQLISEWPHCRIHCLRIVGPKAFDVKIQTIAALLPDSFTLANT